MAVAALASVSQYPVNPPPALEDPATRRPGAKKPLIPFT